MNLVVYGNLIHKGDSNLAILHVQSPLYEPEKDANQIYSLLQEALPPATFAELVALMKMTEPIPF